MLEDLHAWQMEKLKATNLMWFNRCQKIEGQLAGYAHRSKLGLSLIPQLIGLSEC
jgi:hypothetical protein